MKNLRRKLNIMIFNKYIYRKIIRNIIQKLNKLNIYK